MKKFWSSNSNTARRKYQNTRIYFVKYKEYCPHAVSSNLTLSLLGYLKTRINPMFNVQI